MKNTDHFSEQVLEQTLQAVRHQARRRKQYRGGVVAGLFLVSLAALFRPAAEEVAETPPRERAAAAELFEGRVNRFSTCDAHVAVRRVGTEEMSALLGDTPHGIYQTADGKTHFWSPALAARD